MTEMQPVTHPETPVGRPEIPTPGSVPIASEQATDSLHELSASVSPESKASSVPPDARPSKESKGETLKPPTTTETAADQKSPKQAQSPEAREQRVGNRLERIVDHTKTYLSDVTLAYNVAGQRLNGQSVTGRILEGATVTGIGVGFEIFVQNAFSAALGEILAHIPGLGGKAAGIRKVDVRTPVVAGSNTFTTDTFTQPIDANRNVISSDLRTNLRTLLVERLGAEKSGLRMHLVNSLMEGFDDTAVLVMYGLVNRMMGNMLPRIPTEYYGASLALDFLGIGQSPDGTKTDATASVSEAPAAAQSPGIREKFTKGVEFGRGILNYSNPVTLYGLSVMKAGATTYLDTLKAVRAKRKEVESGRAPRVYVGEGAPRGYGQQHRPWEHRRDDRYRGNQGRGGNHG